MPLYRYSAGSMSALPRTTLSAERIRERDDIQQILVNDISIIDRGLLAVAQEYGSFDDSRRRVDILALDKKGTLVVVELKRTEDGGHMELQALRYAAMVSTMTLDHLIETYADSHEIDAETSRRIILDWVDDPIEELPNHVRIILVSADFHTEVTSTVLWLNDNFGTDISCFRMVAYKLDKDVVLDLQQIIPLPEARDFQVQQRRKDSQSSTPRISARDFTKYDLRVGSATYTGISKQAAVKTAVMGAFAAGVDLAEIMNVTMGHRWVAVQPSPGETAQQAFTRQHPESSPKNRWYDMGITQGDTTWIMPRWGGPDTEILLGEVSRVAGSSIDIEWAKSAVRVGLPE